MQIELPSSLPAGIINQSLKVQGFYLFPELCSATLVDQALSLLPALESRRTILNDFHASQSWEEVAIPRSCALARIILDEQSEQQIERELGAIHSAVFWANIYRQGEVIPRHTDTDGDIQLILPFLLSPGACGGRLVVHHQLSDRTVPELVGQRLLFRATKTPHQTTPFRGNRSQQPERIVGVCRMFLSSRLDPEF